ncbi:MAG: C39 family peptidase [Chloroflexi bacterium]|nr:C39 family peptidase [Chloroflexota bacterium]
MRKSRRLLIVLALALLLLPVSPARAESRGAVSGVVTVETGSTSRPVANVEVRLLFGSKSATQRTGADGSYRFADLLDSKYTVRVFPPDGLKVKGNNVVTLEVDDGRTVKVDFALLAEATPTPTVLPTKVVAPTRPPASPSPRPIVATGAEQVAARVVPTVIDPEHAASASPVASPLALLFQTPPPIVTGTPRVTSTGTPTDSAATTPTALPNTPPRRLVTSFAAMRAGSTSTASELRAFSTDSSLVLGVPFRTQIDGTEFSLVNCGPASLAMVLTAFGVQVDPASVRDYLNYIIGNYDTEQGTSLYALARIASEAGLNVFGVSRRWAVEDVREHVRAGQPVITLTKYRRLPGHFGSTTDFDHYIVITGLAGEDFVYNDAAYASEYGYNLLISPAELQRAWGDSSIPGHAMAVGLGDSVRPLPIVPRRLTAENLAAISPEATATVEAPVRAIHGPAIEWLREQMLDRLGARTRPLDGAASPAASSVPATSTSARSSTAAADESVTPAPASTADGGPTTGAPSGDGPSGTSGAASAGGVSSTTSLPAGAPATDGQSEAGSPAASSSAPPLPDDSTLGLSQVGDTIPDGGAVVRERWLPRDQWPDVVAMAARGGGAGGPAVEARTLDADDSMPYAAASDDYSWLRLFGAVSVLSGLCLLAVGRHLGRGRT